MAPMLLTLNDLEDLFPAAGFFNCNVSNICAAFYKISSDSMLAWFLGNSCASCCLKNCSERGKIECLMGTYSRLPVQNTETSELSMLRGVTHVIHIRHTDLMSVLPDNQYTINASGNSTKTFMMI